MACSGSLAEPETKRWQTERELSLSSFADNYMHEFWVERIGNTVRYWVRAGGQSPSFIGQHVCGAGEFGFGQATCVAILNDPIQLILNGEVFVPGYAVNKGSPNDDAWFPNQTMLVDWVVVEQI